MMALGYHAVGATGEQDKTVEVTMNEQAEYESGRRATVSHASRMQEERELERKCSEWRLRGWDIRYILTRSGYTVREFADYLMRCGARITTIRSVYRLMERYDISTRYADHLERLVGEQHYRTFVKEIIKHEERRARERHLKSD
jgi:hypothetical protein